MYVVALLILPHKSSYVHVKTLYISLTNSCFNVKLFSYVAVTKITYYSQSVVFGNIN